MILRKINPNMHEIEYLNHIQVLNANFINDLIANNFVLPNETPVELHPYLNEFRLQNYGKYIIGTFPPISYLCYNPNLLVNGMESLYKPNGAEILPPKISFFHGNRNSMWALLLEHNLHEIVFNNPDRLAAKQSLIDYLTTNQVNYSDIIYSTKRTKYSHEDKYLKNIVLNNDLYKHILQNDHTDRLLFNTSSVFRKSGLSVYKNKRVNSIPGNINVNNGGSFDLFFKGLQDLDAKIELGQVNDINQASFQWIEINRNNSKILKNIFKSQIIIKCRIRIEANNHIIQNNELIQREYFVVTPFSPAAVDRGTLKQNPILIFWLDQNENLAPKDLLTNIYQAFVQFNEDDKTFLINLNHNN